MYIVSLVQILAQLFIVAVPASRRETSTCVFCVNWREEKRKNNKIQTSNDCVDGHLHEPLVRSHILSYAGGMWESAESHRN